VFEERNACVLIPTYNNAFVIAHVLKKILTYTTHILVVNDGSTDDTKNILDGFPSLTVISYEQNKGKGYALQQGFKKAAEQGYAHAITIDSDGQHYPEDFIYFLNQLEQTHDALIIGARNMNQENVPTKSSFGNR